MLKKKKQRKYLEKRNGEWEDNLRKFAGSQDAEALHQLRVALKKIKALAHFSRGCGGKKMVRDFAGLKPMFKEAGVIRDADKTNQEELRTTTTRHFVAHIKQYRRQGKRAGKRLVSTVRAVPTSCIRDWYARQIVSTGILLIATGDELHRARKQIKEMLYMEKILPDALRVELRLDTGYLDRLQEAIGEWHDAVIASSDEQGSREAAVRGLAAEFYLRVNR
jgi:CHAD domain-containing protein